MSEDLGGGAVTLTADLVARAIIAAALSFGDDPVKACIAKRGLHRRCLTPAAEGLHRATDIPFARVARVVGLNGDNRARSAAVVGFEPAARAAMRAVEFALWQPDARESVARAPDEMEPEETAPAEVAQVQALPEPPIRRGAPRAPTFCTATDRALERAARIPPTERPIRDLVLEALAAGPKDSMNIASVIDRKELAVVATLSAMQSEGLLASEPCDGPRRYRWSIVETVS